MPAAKPFGSQVPAQNAMLLPELFTSGQFFGILILCKFAPRAVRLMLKIETYEKDRGI